MGLSAMKYVGFENFTFALGDSWFWKSLWNTTWIALASGAPQHLIAIPLAFFINQSFKKWRNPVLGMYFLPYITSTVAIAMIFGTLFSRDFGVINAAIAGLAKLPLLGAILPTENINWLGNKLFIKPAVSFVIVWRYVGWNTVLYLAAMQTIPKDLYEAARMDGANTRQQFFNITLPMIRPMMFFAISLTIIGNLQIFEEPFILMGPSGGLGQTALTSAMFMYRTAFEFNDFGTASAMSWMLFLLIGVLTVVNNKIFATDDGRNG
ncbi:MAG: sugar ABC transporter permease [Pseudomonadota bacterium]